MPKLLFFLLLSALLVAPMRVSAMMEADKKKERKESGGSKETLKKNTDEKWSEAHEKTAERVNNPAANNNTETEGEMFIEKKEIIEGEALQSFPNADARLNLSESHADEESDDNSLLNIATLEQRIQEAREIIADLGGKGTAISEEELCDLFKKWSERNERYQRELQSSDLEHRNDIGLIAKQQIEDRLTELVQASGKAVEALQQSLENFTRNNATRAGNPSCLKDSQRWFIEKKTAPVAEAVLDEQQQPYFLECLARVVTRASLKEDPHYALAEVLWDEREQAWEKHHEYYKLKQQKKNALIIAQEKAKQALEVDEKRDETQLGQFKQKLEQVAQALHYVPEPHTQLLATGMDTAASAVDWINFIWTKHRLHQVRADENEAIKAHQKAKEAAKGATINITGNQPEETEKRLLEQEKETTKQLANGLRPQAGWGEHAWESWSNRLLGDLSYDEKRDFIRQGQESQKSRGWIVEQSATAWKDRQNESKKQLELLTRENKKVIASLETAHHRLEKNLQEKVKKSENQRDLFQEAHAKAIKYKKRIETFLEEYSQEQSKEWNQRKIDQAQETFRSDFNNLIDNYRWIGKHEASWNESLELQGQAILEAKKTSQKHESTFKKYQRLLHRAERQLENDQEQLRQVWPEYDTTFRPYLAWELPFHEETISASIPVKTTFKKSGIIEPPVIPKEEREVKGRHLLYQFQRAIEKELNFSLIAPLGLQEEGEQISPSKTETISSSKSDIKSETSEERTLSPYEALLVWSREQVNKPSIADRQRWKARKQFEEAHQETRKLFRLLEERKNYLVEEQGASRTLKGEFNKSDKGNASAENLKLTPEALASHAKQYRLVTQKEDKPLAEVATNASWRTKFTEKTRSFFSRFTTSTGTVFENRSLTVASIELQIQQALPIEKKAEERWLTLMNHAEVARSAREKNSLGTPKQIEKIWAEADHAALKKQQEAEGLLQEKREADAMQTHWDESNLRWRALAEEIQAGKEGRAPALLWDHYAQQQASILTAQKKGGTALTGALEKLKAFDEAVLTRWHQLQSPKAIDTPEEDYLNQLSLTLNKKGEEIFKTAVTCELGIKKYKQLTKQEALRAARENTPKAAEAWKERIRDNQEKIETWEKKCADDITSKQETSETRNIRDLLPQLRGILEADQKAQSLFEEEERRLSRIEKIWKSIQEAKEKATFQKAQEAALRYHQGDRRSWEEELTEEERQAYNNHLDKKNQSYDQKLANEERELEQTRQILEEKQQKTERFLSRLVGGITGQQQATLDAIREAQEHYDRGYQQWAEQKEELQWGSFETAEEYQKAIAQKRQEITTREKRKNEKIFLNVVSSVLAEGAPLFAEEGTFVRAAYDNAVKYWNNSAQRRLSGKTGSWFWTVAAFNNLNNRLKGKEGVSAAYQQNLVKYILDLVIAYEKAAKQEKAAQFQIADSYHKAIFSYYGAIENEREAFVSSEEGENELAQYERQLSSYQNSLGDVYFQMARQAAKNPQHVENYRQAIPFYKQAIENEEAAITSFQAGEKKLAEHQEALSVLQQALGETYWLAAREEATGNLYHAENYRPAIFLYEQAIESYKAAIVFFHAGEKELAKYQKDLSDSQRKVGSEYFTAAFLGAGDNMQNAKNTLKEIPRLEQLVENRKQLVNYQHNLRNANCSAIEQEAAGKPQFAVGYRQAVPFFTQAIESTKAAIDSSYGNESKRELAEYQGLLSTCYNYEGCSHHWNVYYQVKEKPPLASLALEIGSFSKNAVTNQEAVLAFWSQAELAAPWDRGKLRALASIQQEKTLFILLKVNTWRWEIVRQDQSETKVPDSRKEEEARLSEVVALYDQLFSAYQKAPWELSTKERERTTLLSKAWKTYNEAIERLGENRTEEALQLKREVEEYLRAVLLNYP
ncbi:MAG: hypothetical protein K2W99_03165 [Chthoniobacterales bacterium]|nr:hypothetical protein [Chthoniobacterales bacterium]